MKLTGEADLLPYEKPIRNTKHQALISNKLQESECSFTCSSKYYEKNNKPLVQCARKIKVFRYN